MPKVKDPIDEVFKLVVKESGKEYVQDSGSDQIFVIIDVKDSSDITVDTRRLGFPLETPVEEVKDELKKFIKNYNKEYHFGLKQKALDEKQENADNVIGSLQDLEIDSKGTILEE